MDMPALVRLCPLIELIYAYIWAARGAIQLAMSCTTICYRKRWFACGMLPRSLMLKAPDI